MAKPCEPKFASLVKGLLGLRKIRCIWVLKWPTALMCSCWKNCPQSIQQPYRCQGRGRTRHFWALGPSDCARRNQASSWRCSKDLPQNNGWNRFWRSRWSPKKNCWHFWGWYRSICRQSLLKTFCRLHQMRRGKRTGRRRRNRDRLDCWWTYDCNQESFKLDLWQVPPTLSSFRANSDSCPTNNTNRARIDKCRWRLDLHRRAHLQPAESKREYVGYLSTYY